MNTIDSMNLINKGLYSDSPLVIWKPPKSKIVYFMLDIDLPCEYEEYGFCNGFYIFPFLHHSPPTIIKKNIWGNATLTKNGELPHFSLNFKNKEASKIFSNLKNIGVPRKTPQPFPQKIEDGKQGYLQLVQQAVKTIQSGKLDKVVLSRRQKFQYPLDFDGIQYFFRLCHNYPHAFVSWLLHPLLGNWMGASPETFLQSDKDKLKTFSLAATKKHSQDQERWTKKEKKEQKFVCNYVKETLNRLQLNYSFTPTEVVHTGNMYHLNNIFYIEIKQRDFFSTIKKLIRQLHPTPAVCGIPLTVAKKFILETETQQRELYSGLLGVFDIDNKYVDIFVNLRCMKLCKEYFYLYAGGGIISESVPEEEFLETEIKMQTLLRFIK